MTRLSRADCERLGIDFESGTLKEGPRPAKPLVPTIAPLPPRQGVSTAVRAGLYLRIEGWRPPTNNEMLRGKRKDRIRLAAECKAIIGEAAEAAGLPPATTKRRVSLLIELPPGQRTFDPDAFHKSLGDSLAACGQLRSGDGYAHVRWGDVDYARTERLATVIYLEDIGPAPGGE